MKYKATLCALCVCLNLSGCWDKVELENRGFVSSFGIDAYSPKRVSASALQIQSPSSSERFATTVSIPRLEKNEGNASIVLTSAGDTLMSALSLISLGTSQEPYYGQTKAIILGESLIQDAKLLSQAIDALERNREISRKVVILASRGDAAEILRAQTEGEELGMHISNFYDRRSVALGMAFKKDLESVLKDLRSFGGTVIPEVSVTEGVVSLSGAALVSDFALSGWLDDLEVRGLMLALGRGENSHITAAFDKTLVPLRLSSQTSRVRFERGEKGLECFFNIRAKGSVGEYNANSPQDISSPENVSHLNMLFAQSIEKEVSAAIERLKSSGVDGFGLLERMRKFNYDLYEEFVILGQISIGDIKITPIAEVHVTDVGATR